MIDFSYTTKQLVLNPEFRMQNDIKRIILASDSIFTMIHPLHAMMLSFFDQPLHYADAIDKIHDAIPINKENIDTFLKQLIYNESEVWIGQNETAVQFPKCTLIGKPDNYKKRNYQVRDFFIESNNVDLLSSRFYKPLDAMLMINTSCYTDCVYCYADRTKKITLLCHFNVYLRL